MVTSSIVQRSDAIATMATQATMPRIPATRNCPAFLSYSGDIRASNAKMNGNAAKTPMATITGNGAQKFTLSPTREHGDVWVLATFALETHRINVVIILKTALCG